MTHRLKIRFVPGRYTISRLPADAQVPDWFAGSGFRALVCSDDETTLICLEDRVPDTVQSEGGWTCLRTVGPFPFEAAGIVQSLIAPLSDNGIGVFVVCTFDGEHVLIPTIKAGAAARYLQAAGHDCPLPDLADET
ncbi:ACT domain-containing protein [Thalassobius sp. Cn5-15]|uniref:ACT domain-containing protein n=1 Tax=Thalassobius sp. Cn5-15 TaxID=2917763 RepID=UPI001EF2CAFD|nr:ACT domain-containing protein [Thalassobius sp. Cn5-15]MCG7492520.1 ACT domain-containing protein [Thalassobius sp. Cn5-15]